MFKQLIFDIVFAVAVVTSIYLLSLICFIYRAGNGEGVGSIIDVEVIAIAIVSVIGSDEVASATTGTSENPNAPSK